MEKLALRKIAAKHAKEEAKRQEAKKAAEDKLAAQDALRKRKAAEIQPSLNVPSVSAAHHKLPNGDWREFCEMQVQLGVGSNVNIS